MTIDTSTLDAPSRIRPLQLLSLAGIAQVPAPLVRVTTCGLLTLEIFEDIINTDPLQARYRVLTPDLLHGRGVIPALTLLKLLTSRPERFAPNEWLREQFCQAQGEAFSSKRLDTLTSLLRDLLCPSDYQDLRTTLVANIRAMSGSGYRLAASPLIWLDHEALAWNVEQAIRMERFGDDPLPFWQRAYELAKRGEYLPDEVYGEWASVKREQIAGMLRQSVQALARLYADQGNKASEEEALLLLRTYWQEHPHDEDALRPLMELLGRRECYQEALAYYEKLCALLEEDGEQPSKQTQDVAEYVYTKQIQRISTKAKRMEREEASQQRSGSLPPFSQEDREDIIQEISRLCSAFGMNALRRTIRQSFPHGGIVFSSEQASLLFSLVQEQIMMEHFDPQKRKTLETLLAMLGIASVGFPLTNPQTWEDVDRLTTALRKPSAIDREVVKGLKNTSASYWHLRLAGTISSAELFSAIEQQYQVILRLLQSPLLPSIRVALCSVASETALLGGMLLATDLSQFEQAQSYYKEALTLTQQTNNDALYAAVLGRIGAFSARLGKVRDACCLLQEAQRPLQQFPASPLRAWLAAEEAEVQASLSVQEKELHTAACFAALGQAEALAYQMQSDEDSFGMYFDVARIPAYRGSCHLRLHAPEAALADLMEALEPLDALGALRRAVLLDLAEASIQAHDIELACVYLEQSLEMAGEFHLTSVFQRIHHLRSQLDPWSDVQVVQDLDERLRPFSITVC
ncbi:MAG TPA: bacterial transcriptional activator domain-containing protein [Ktedonobacteraceae bacterium]|nr:bacterial transcriptional activator domain-containing protein [Ktedonobacteraceae bacterium]